LYVRYLHINNSIWVLIVPGALNAFNMFLMKNYFTSIPESLSESAKIDGANDVYIYFKIILPLSAPILATIGLFAAMGYWNSWFNVLMYIDNPKLYTLQYLIMRLQRAVDFLNSELGSKSHITQQPPGYTIRMATAMISIGPIILLYPFLQKYFIKGIMVGSVKG
jgi:putative aldouronate transport system permease protein